MNIAKLVRRNAAPANDGLPSTQELLQDESSSFLRELTAPKQAEVEYVQTGPPHSLVREDPLANSHSALLLCTV